MNITSEVRPVSTYPFEVFQTPLGSTLYTKFEVKTDLTVASVPSSVIDQREITSYPSDMINILYD